jgi:hypothetical protein
MKPMLKRVITAAAALAWIGVGVAVSTASCAGAPDTSRVTTIIVPSLDAFENNNVSTMFERRCGTLDCHGQVGRPMRIYGQFGLRLLTPDVLNIPGGNAPATTTDEKLANFQSIVSIEPEIMSQVIADNFANPTPGDPEADRLLIVKKPEGLERHKGGTVIVKNPPDDADTCLRAWLMTVEKNQDQLNNMDNAGTLMNTAQIQACANAGKF